METYKITVLLEVGGQKIEYITSGNLEVLTDETIRDRFVRDHKILKKQGDVKVLQKTQGSKIGL